MIATLVAIAIGLGIAISNVPGRSSSMPAAPATPPETEAADLSSGDLPIIGDPIRDLTIWWSNRLTDANRAGLDSLRGRTLTPIDPMADDVVRGLYGKILRPLRHRSAGLRLDDEATSSIVAALAEHDDPVALRRDHRSW